MPFKDVVFKSLDTTGPVLHVAFLSPPMRTPCFSLYTAVPKPQEGWRELQPMHTLPPELLALWKGWRLPAEGI